MSWKPNKDHSVCYYCGVKDKKVEAAGMWYCPNPRCEGPGAYWFRSRLLSFTESGNGSHTVDPVEWENAAKLYQETKMTKPNRPSYWKLPWNND